MRTIKAGHPHNIALCGIICALCMLLGWISQILPFNKLFALLLMSVLTGVAAMRCGLKAVFCMYGAAGLLLILLIRPYSVAAGYIILFGLYPILKLLCETKIKSRNFRILFKIVIFALQSAVFTAIAALWLKIEFKYGYLAMFLAIVAVMYVLELIITYSVYMIKKFLIKRGL